MLRGLALTCALITACASAPIVTTPQAPIYPPPPDALLYSCTLHSDAVGDMATLGDLLKGYVGALASYRACSIRLEAIRSYYRESSPVESSD